MTTEDIYRVAMDSLAVHVAIVDENGVILETNRAWQEFGRANGLEGPVDCRGIDYLEACEAGCKEEGTGEEPVAKGIRSVLRGEQAEFYINYPCHSPNRRRWYSMRVVPLRQPGPRRVVISHEEITPIMEAQQALAAKEAELAASNVALRVLLEERARERARLEGKVLTNVRELILPLVERLGGARLGEQERSWLALIDARLREIVAPFRQRLTTLHRQLTPREIEVATLVREGKSSQEIAGLLNISQSGVDFHRKQLRKKLGLSDRGANLRAHLLALQ